LIYLNIIRSWFHQTPRRIQHAPKTRPSPIPSPNTQRYLIPKAAHPLPPPISRPIPQNTGLPCKLSPPIRYCLPRINNPLLPIPQPLPQPAPKTPIPHLAQTWALSWALPYSQPRVHPNLLQNQPSHSLLILFPLYLIPFNIIPIIVP
jgi:hypothetical protein